MKKFIIIGIVVLLLALAFVFRNNILSLFNTNIEFFEEDVPEGIILTDEEIKFSKAINNIEEEKEKIDIIEDVKNVEPEISPLATCEEIDPLKAYDEYMASALNVSVEDAANERMIDGLKIAMCTIDDTLDVTNFDIYTQIALFYFVHVDGSIVDVYKTCKNEEDVKKYLIAKDGMGKLKFSTIINEHKFVR